MNTAKILMLDYIFLNQIFVSNNNNILVYVLDLGK